MSTPQDRPKGAEPDGGDDLYRVSEPIEPRPMAGLVARYMRAAEEDARRPGAAEEPPPPPSWPMLSGVFTFPWYLSTLAQWLWISLGLIVSGLMFMLLWGPGAVLGLLAARLLGPPACAAATLALSYAFACSLCIIEETSNGWDAVDTWPELNWKEWVWSFAHVTALLAQAGVVGLLLRLATPGDSWLPMVVGTMAALPVVLLGALAAGGAWVPMAVVPVLRSIPSLWRTWALFHLETGAMAAGWWWLTVAGLWSNRPWLTPLYSGPLLAAAILIYARLAGRLAGCIAEQIEARSETEEEA